MKSKYGGWQKVLDELTIAWYNNEIPVIEKAIMLIQRIAIEHGACLKDNEYYYNEADKRKVVYL
jgi:hypothetical protein